MLFWLLIILGAIVGVALLITIVGLALPKSHSASVAARYSQPPELVFDAGANWREYPAWRKDLKGVKQRTGEAGRESWIELSRMGDLPFEIVETDPPRKLIVKIASDKLPFGGSWTYLIEPREGGCTLTITENGEIYNPIFRFIARFFLGYTLTMKQFHKALSRKFAQACDIVSG